MHEGWSSLCIHVVPYCVYQTGKYLRSSFHITSQFMPSWSNFDFDLCFHIVANPKASRDKAWPAGIIFAQINSYYNGMLPVRI